MQKIILSLLVLFLLPHKNHAQDSNAKKEQAAKALSDYFSLERENIHVHLDKNTFVATEQIWYKGYVFHRKKNLPFFSVTNVYATLLDGDGKILDSQLVYANIGSFTGSFKLNRTLKTGTYYLQFYTNWMNNFTEDESAVYEISIIGEEGAIPPLLRKPDYAKINIDLRPEGGTFVQDAPNSFGISVSDCNHDPVPVSVADIVNASGEVIKKVQLNKLGYGKFDLPAGSAPGYKVAVTLEGTRHEQALPAMQPRGVGLEVNNYSMPDKIITKIRTNTFTMNELVGKPLFMVVHQDDKAAVFEVNFNDKKPEQTLVFADSELYEGANTIRILDSDLNQLAERVVFKYPKTGIKSEINKTMVAPDVIEMAGKINYPNMNVSISVLPENTRSMVEDSDIFGSFLIQPYIQNQKRHAGKYYLEKLSKTKHYELDLYLLSQKSRYQWRDILKNPPKSNYPFDMGLSIKGKVPGTVIQKGNLVRLYSLTSSLDETADIDDKNEFYFHNLVVPDSTYINFTLLRKGEKPKEINVVPQMINASRPYYKMFKPAPSACPPPPSGGGAFELPVIFDKTTVLDEIVIEGRALKYASSFGNANLTGYKITETQDGTPRRAQKNPP